MSVAQEFVFDFPIWFVVTTRDGSTPDRISLADHNVGIPRARGPDGQFFQFFTEELLAERFAKWFGIEKPIFVPVADASVFLILLLEIEKLGYTHMGVDHQGESHGKWTFTIEAAREAVKRTMRS